MFAVLGTTNVDLIVLDVEHVPRLAGDEFTTDSLVFCENPLSVVLGGNGGNAAYALGKLGAPVTLCSAIGRDPLGGIIRRWLSDAGVHTSGLVQKGTHATATTTIITDTAQNRLSYHHRGAMGDYSPPDFTQNLLEQTRVLLISSYPLLRRWTTEDFTDLLAAAKRHNAITALDIGPAITPPATLQTLRGLLPRIDFLIGNAHELTVFTGSDDLRAGMEQVVAAGAPCLVVKRGREGVLIGRAGHENPLAVPGFPVDARSTVGAGDSFNAGFLYGVDRGWDLEQAARFGNAVAALVVSSGRGILESPNVPTVETFLRSAPPS